MTERFSWLVERLYRANLRMDRCQTDEERQRARAWLQVWNRALRREHEQANGQKEIQPDPAHPSDPVRLNL
jgi:flagellin-specific chaperone FliS